MTMKKSALILGGGIAGLAAARELAQQGVFVTVIEAKKRLGGRVHTVREGMVPIELGAEFVHGRSKDLMHHIQEAQLSTLEVSDDNYLFKGGAFQPVKMWDLVTEVIGRVNPRAPDCSMRAFLAGQKLNAQTRMLTVDFVEGFDAAHTERVSAHSLRRARYSGEQIEVAKQLRIEEGYTALVQFLEREIYYRGGMLVKGAAARQIKWRPDGVEVTVQQGSGAQQHSADVAIVTLPLGVLKSGTVTCEPPLPEKQEAIREMEFGNVVKIVFLFKHRWWRATGMLHAPGERIPTWWDDPRAAMLTGWAGGPKADALLNCSPAELENIGLEILSRILFEKPEVIRRHFGSSYSWNWAHDPHIGGAYSYIPVNGMDLPKILAAPVGETLFFAGEATVTDAQTGTVFGALQTGLRAAKEALDSLSSSHDHGPSTSQARKIPTEHYEHAKS